MIEHYDKCVLLLPMKGENDGIIFTDRSYIPYISTAASGNVKTVTDASSPYGSSGEFSGGYIDVTPRSAFVFGTSDFAVRFKFKVASFADMAIFDMSSSASGLYYEMTFRLLSSTQCYIYVGRRGSSCEIFRFNFPSTLNAGTWYDLEFNRASNQIYGFLDGQAMTSGQHSSNCGGSYSGATYPRAFNYDFTSEMPVNIGRFGMSNSGIFDGNLIDLAVWKGVALHTSNFTPPGKLTGTISNAGSGVPAILNAAGNPFESRVQAIPRGIDRVFSTTADSSGRFSMDLPMVEHSVLFVPSATDTHLGVRFLSRVMPS